MGALDDKITAVEAALEKQPPFCTGLMEINEQSSAMFYRKEGNSAGFISFVSADVENLQALTDACTPAKFGRGNQDVYDESYRKARKMNTKDFMMAFDPSPIVKSIRQTLLDGEDQSANLELELYQLNVYDKGSFFKAHRDTPRSRDMFASLVIVFPAAHEGGKLLLRHDGEEWTFDSADMLSKATTPSAAFIAFYSDVEHEVTMVESGYRVTITYNIYRGRKKKAKGPAVKSTIQSNRNIDASVLKTTISSLLQDPECLPQGGYYGFGLRFLYPAFGGADFDLQTMLEQLKGSDSIINQVCTSLSLKTSLRIFINDVSSYNSSTGSILLKSPKEFENSCEEVEDLMYALESHGIREIYNWQKFPSRDVAEDYDSEEEYCPDGATWPVLWLSSPTASVEYSSDYISYGNEPSMGNVYGWVCLIVKVGPVSGRETEK
ncbi:hypothetical protein BDN72DRAFT_893677 [Pluteus cervinus]|uniref:Uncharacterized protein n=1 Tax=Pluteus cervinus TaxID=181527 RepID=A0ACD3B7P8_9AGAR|nr:hypothetical protein BDN72DRAFT_893677 [Pluteus cervinus]